LSIEITDEQAEVIARINDHPKRATSAFLIQDENGQVAKIRANREKALFSHIFNNKAREWGYTSGQSPCQGVKGFKEKGRDRYITDAEFDQVTAHAHFTVVEAMELALLTGQRPADVLKFKRTDIRDGALWIIQNKTGLKPPRIPEPLRSRGRGILSHGTRPAELTPMLRGAVGGCSGAASQRSCP
jgi:integrase